MILTFSGDVFHGLDWGGIMLPRVPGTGLSVMDLELWEKKGSDTISVLNCAENCAPRGIRYTGFDGLYSPL